MSISSNQNNSHKKGVSHDISNANTSVRHKSLLDPMHSKHSIHETDDFIIKNNKAKMHDYKQSNTVRRNIDGYDDLIEENFSLSKPNQAMNNPNQSSINIPNSSVKFTSQDYSKKSPKKKDNINELLKEIDSDDDMGSKKRN